MVVPSGELYRGIVSSLRRIWRREGVRGLYRGLGTTMVGYLPTWYARLRDGADAGEFIFQFMRSVRLFMLQTVNTPVAVVV
jgi:Mitochondrial carrier protein